MDELPRAERCGTCRFWVSDGGEDSNMELVGECRSSAPVRINLDLPEEDRFLSNQYRAIWPETGEGDWCGEWQGKEG